MAVLKLLVKLTLIYHVVKSETTSAEVCGDDFRNISTDEPVNKTKYCEEKRCISKCCQEGQVFYQSDIENQTESGCVTLDYVRNITNKNFDFDYKDVEVHEFNSQGTELEGKSYVNLREEYQFVRNVKMSDDECSSNLFVQDPLEGFMLGKDSILIRELPNYKNRWSIKKMEDFCLEYVVTNVEELGVLEPFLGYRAKNIDIDYTEDENFETASTALMLVTFFFLLLVLFVYGSIRELRNMAGLVLMAYVATLALTFLLHAINKLLDSDSKPEEFCKGFSAVTYALTLSYFFWMNIMSWDIWWSFRGMFKSREIHRRGILFKFLWYGLYAWGVPILIMIAVVAIDNSDLSKHPDIFKPHFDNCLRMTKLEPELFYYLYLPCLALIVLNWLFYLMTAFNIWRIRINMNRFENEAAKYKNNQNRFGLYLKLAFVMGLSWILEMITDLPDWLEKTARVYNDLIGVAIFIIFVCKRKILLLLLNRYKMKGKLVENLQRKYSSHSTSKASNSDRKQSTVEAFDISTNP